MKSKGYGIYDSCSRESYRGGSKIQPLNIAPFIPLVEIST